MEPIKIKSKTMQQILGKDEIEYFEEIAEKIPTENYFQKIVIQDDDISEEEMLDLIDDCKKIGEKNGYIFSIANIPDRLKEKFIIYNIKGAVLQIDLAEIQEEDRITQEWENTEVQVSPELYEILKKEYKKDKITLSDIYFSQKVICTENIETYLEYRNLFPGQRYFETEPMLCIKSREDIQKLLEHESIGRVNFDIDDMSLLSLDDLEKLSKVADIGNVFVQNEREYEKEHSYKRLRYNYTLEQYISLRKAVDKILEDIDLNAPDIEKFLRIYQKLGEKIIYDRDEDGEPNERDNAHNLIGGLIEGKCVCEGYALALKQVLKCAGIECKYICDKSKDEEPKKDEKESRHAWNQVKINGIWYNCDLTWDATRIVDKCKLDYCLQSDEEFINHNTDCKWREKCTRSYDINEINRILNEEEDIRKKLQSYCKGQSVLSQSELREECEHIGLNFDNEFKRAYGKVELELELDKYTFEEDEEITIIIPEERKKELYEKARKLGLNFEKEIKGAIERADFRSDLPRYINMEGFDKKWAELICEELGLNWDEEVDKILDRDKKDRFIKNEQIQTIAKDIEVIMGKKDASDLAASLEPNPNKKKMDIVKE